MQLSRIEELKAFASTLPPQFPDLQFGHQLPKAPITQHRSSEFVALEQAAMRDTAALSNEQLIQKYGTDCAALAIARAKTQAPTPKQIFWKHKRAIREADLEKGKALAASGIQVQHHSEADYKHGILTQLDLLLQGMNPSGTQVLKTAFPNDPKKAVSIGNSRYPFTTICATTAFARGCGWSRNTGVSAGWQLPSGCPRRPWGCQSARLVKSVAVTRKN